MFGKKNKKTKKEELSIKDDFIRTAANPAPGDDGELIAVLTAAVAAILGADSNGIIIRSYQRISPSAWKKSARDFQIFNHF